MSDILKKVHEQFGKDPSRKFEREFVKLQQVDDDRRMCPPYLIYRPKDHNIPYVPGGRITNDELVVSHVMGECEYHWYRRMDDGGFAQIEIRDEEQVIHPMDDRQLLEHSEVLKAFADTPWVRA